MKFSVKSSDLRDVLLSVINVVPTKTTLPILGNVLFSLKDDKLYLSATDLEVTIRTSIKVKVEKEGGVALPGKIIGDIIRQLPDVPLDITVDENYRVNIKTEIGEYVISGENESEFPSIPKADIKHEIDVESDVLERIISKALFAISMDGIKSSIMGVYLQFLKNELRAVSTDGHRLVRVINKNVKIKEDIGGYITSPKALGQFLKNRSEGGTVKLSISDNYLMFNFDNFVVYSRLIEGMYPDYEKVIPKDNKNRLVVDRNMMESSVKRILVFANKVTQQIKLKLSENSIEISSEDVDYGKEGREKITADYNGEEMIIGYNAGYILDVLGHIDTEKVVFDFGSSTSAGLAYPSEQRENEDILMLIMPIKLID